MRSVKEYLFEFDERACPAGLVAGVDEAGRGPLAGPVVSAAVILKKGARIPGLNDSKKLSPASRAAVYEKILLDALDYGISVVDNLTIDRLNILEATRMSMKNAVEMLVSKPDLVLIDGNVEIDIVYRQQTVVAGDAKSASVAAASILAKVTRDRIMIDFDKKYPQYGFSEHKGYGTEKHMSALAAHGPCEIHRRSFRPVTIHDERFRNR